MTCWPFFFGASALSNVKHNVHAGKLNKVMPCSVCYLNMLLSTVTKAISPLRLKLTDDSVATQVHKVVSVQCADLPSGPIGVGP